MSNYGRHDPDGVDWLDLGPDPDEGAQPRDPRRRYLWYAAAAGLVVVALVLTRTQHGTNQAAPATASSPRSTSSSPPQPVPTGPSSSGAFVNPTAASSNGAFPDVSAPPPKVTSLGRPLLKVPADWELFAQGAGVVVRIQLALGRVTTTTVPVPNSDTPITFLVTADRAFVRPMDDTAGYVVPDGKRPVELPEALQRGFSLYPGPDQRHLWTSQVTGPGGLALVNLDGKPTGATIDLPANASVRGSDGAGYVLLEGIDGGVYEARPGSTQRITSGVLVAVGATRWLALECDSRLSCAHVVIDRATGARRLLDTPIGYVNASSGTISPDGRTAALPRYDGISPSAIHLLDLHTGAETPVEVVLRTEGFPVGPTWAWSPDSRWLFVTDAAGRVVVVNRGTGRATPLGARLVPVAQLAIRHNSTR